MSRRRTLMSVGPKEPGPPTDSLDFSSAGPADWETVESLLEHLAESRAVFPTRTSDSTWISAYEPGRHVMIETGQRSTRVQVEHLKACWETFERLGRVRRQDVLEPGRCSALVMALFEQLPGVRRSHRGDALVLSSGRATSSTPRAGASVAAQ